MPPVSKTCQSCAESKVRCIRGPENPHVCNRYDSWSLGVSLVVNDPAQLSPSRSGMCVSPNRSTLQWFSKRSVRIEALESKIQELMAERSAPAIDSDASASTRSPSASEANAADDDIIGRGLLNLEAAETYLLTFKHHMTPFFPFVVIPPQVSADQLRHEKPFLFLAVMASASYTNMPLQRSLGAEVRKAVSSRMLLNSEVSFDLLQGLLVFLAWSHYHTRPHRYTQFLQLAVSLVIELRLDRPPQTKTWKTKLRFDPKHDLQQNTYDRPSWGSDEQRAVIGCYYLSSTISVLVQKLSTFPYFPYLDECCKSLHDVGEYPCDKYIKYIVQLQLIADKVDRLSVKHEAELQSPGSGSELYITNLKSELETFQKQLPFNMQDIPMLAIHFNATGICLYQLALTMARQQPESPFTMSQIWRDEMFFAGQFAANTLLDLHLALPANSDFAFNNTQWVQLGFAMLVAYQHVVSVSTISHTTSFLHTLSRLQQRVGSMSTAEVDDNGDRDVFFDFQRRISQIQSRLDGHGRPEPSVANHMVMEELRYAPQASAMSGMTYTEQYPAATNEQMLPYQDMLPVMGDSYNVSPDYYLATSIEQMVAGWT
ncbi:hypothetical protein NUU61_006319 [Penicillium alfredii]|uniref:Transcription factor domain-containing protein n=1 Tax=Penicillium alfredii TaxID=1506179 RepID=A0A9W9F0R5_9EURO|nr:uncharacterized protein NUU61_006319 [Penicillium alfredii]KAJ5091449.1 hypothetical protein NUU61_006319 [Penicillium alfredii]